MIKNLKYFSIVCLIGLNACGNKTSEKAQESTNNNDNIIALTTEQLQNSHITTDTIGLATLPELLIVNGKIEVPPQNLVSISMPMGGYLKTTKLLPGMFVKKGEVIASIEDQQYIELQENYLTAKAQLTAIEAEYLRQKELNQTKATSDKVFQQAQADYLSKKILLKSLHEKLKLVSIDPEKLNEDNISRTINIYSPINGFVSKVNQNVGKYVAATEPLFELIDPHDVHLMLNVFEKDIHKISIGQTVIAYSNANPNKKYPATIIMIGQNIDPVNRSVEVHCHFEQQDKNLVPGMYMNAEIKVKNEAALLVPSQAIVTFEGKQYIFSKINTQQFQPHQVFVINTQNNYSQIRFANNVDYKNKQFVMQGAYTLLSVLKNTEE